LFLCLTKHNSTLDGGEWSASSHCRFTPREKALVPIDRPLKRLVDGYSHERETSHLLV